MGLGSPGVAERSRRWTWRRPVAVGLAVAVVAGTVVGVSYVTGRVGPQDPGAAGGLDGVGDTVVPFCGVADPSRYTALPASVAAGAPVVQTLVEEVTLPSAAPPGTPVGGLAVADGLIATLAWDGAEAVVTQHTLEGRERDSFTVPTAEGGQPPASLVLLDDGTVVMPSSAAGTPGVIGYSPGGDVRWSVDLSSLGRGRVVSVFAWPAGHDGAVASVGFEDSDQLATITADGDVEPDGPSVARGLYFPLGDGTLLVRSEPEPDEIVMTRYEADARPTGEFTGTGSESSANGGQPIIERPTGVVLGPDGGLLIYGPRVRLIETTDDGVWRRTSVSGEGNGPAAASFAEQSPLVRSGDRYYFYAPGEDGTTALVSTDLAGMDAVLDAPLTWSLATAALTDRLGYGAGLATDAAYDYFGPGSEPQVYADFERWGQTFADSYELRYRVTGDPAMVPPVEGVSGTADIPEDGGRVELTLPEARPGPYEVHAELVEKDSGLVRTATCLRYAVGSAEASFDPDSLADGADWGGAGPLRGVQLADQLGIGSHRVQLDVSRLVPDVDAPASAAGLDLGALPGADEDDPFGGLRRAAQAAERLDVELIVQVAQGQEVEHEMVSAGTWGPWVEVVVEAFADEVPQIVLWAPWNEPNITGFDDGAAYATEVLAPFSAAVRGVRPEARVIGGNALNVDVGWYRQAVEAGACEWLDVVGIHPYTGFNRSWDEEGVDGPIGQIAELGEVLDTCGADRPEVWNTESGWWSDGAANHWAQAHDVARTMLWQRSAGIDEWTYFFSEGGWGEGGFSWSLLQMESFVKPGALAMATVSDLLEGRPSPEVVQTGIPYTRAMRADAAPGDQSELLALWTEDATVPVSVVAADDVAVVVTDVYGGTRELALTAGSPQEIVLSGAPVFLAAPLGSELAVEPVEALGDNLLVGGTVTASSSAEGADPQVLVSPGGTGAEPWSAGQRTPEGPDTSPWVQVELDSPTTIDRVVVQSAGIRCCTSGIRAYSVEILSEDEEWLTVGQAGDLFHERTSIVRFDAVTALAVRVQVPSTEIRDVTVPDVNHSGQTAGLPPAWEPIAAEPAWPVRLSSLAAYGPG